MLSVAVHKDIGEYQPKLIGKMTTRTLASIAGALGASILAGLDSGGIPLPQGVSPPSRAARRQAWSGTR